jgi:hypothetical protein
MTFILADIRHQLKPVARTDSPGIGSHPESGVRPSRHSEFENVVQFEKEMSDEMFVNEITEMF